MATKNDYLNVDKKEFVSQFNKLIKSQFNKMHQANQKGVKMLKTDLNLDWQNELQKYVNNEIDSLLLILQFFQIQRKDKKILKRILIDPKSGEFSLLIADIFYAYDILKSDSEPE